MVQDVRGHRQPVRGVRRLNTMPLRTGAKTRGSYQTRHAVAGWATALRPQCCVNSANAIAPAPPGKHPPDLLQQSIVGCSPPAGWTLQPSVKPSGTIRFPKDQDRMQLVPLSDQAQARGARLPASTLLYTVCVSSSDTYLDNNPLVKCPQSRVQIRTACLVYAVRSSAPGPARSDRSAILRVETWHSSRCSFAQPASSHCPCRS